MAQHNNRPTDQSTRHSKPNWSSSPFECSSFFIKIACFCFLSIGTWSVRNLWRGFCTVAQQVARINTASEDLVSEKLCFVQASFIRTYFQSQSVSDNRLFFIRHPWNIQRHRCDPLLPCRRVWPFSGTSSGTGRWDVTFCQMVMVPTYKRHQSRVTSPSPTFFIWTTSFLSPTKRQGSRLSALLI